MGVWDLYEARMSARGVTKREATLKREKAMLARKLPDSLSYQQGEQGDQRRTIVDGEVHDIAVVDTDNLNEKQIFSLEPDVLFGGSLVEWADNYWLITELDAHDEVYTEARMTQCNHLLKWIDEGSVIHERWCVVEDGTKYLVGESEGTDSIAYEGSTRIAVTVARDEDTVKLNRTRRFLIDDDDAEHKLAYTLSKPLKIGAVYKSKGVYSFVLQEVVSTDYDNHELGIADYYKYFPKEILSEDSGESTIDPDANVSENGKKVWL